jgi:HlyD family secretion protein
VGSRVPTQGVLIKRSLLSIGQLLAVTTKLAGRVLEVLGGESDFVKAGQAVAPLQIDGLQAQREKASARLQESHVSAGGLRKTIARIV